MFLSFSLFYFVLFFYEKKDARADNEIKNKLRYELRNAECFIETPDLLCCERQLLFESRHGCLV